MAKTKTAYVCQNCGADSPKWLGKCPSCGEWNTYVEEILETKADKNKVSYKAPGEKSKPVSIKEVRVEKEQRINTGNNELNRVLGGGLVHGAMVLLGGEPGIGKSTLVLQVALNIPGKKVLYISGEESHQQLKLRADRIAAKNEMCYVVSETSLERAINHAQQFKPDVLIVDSIQTMATERVESSPGSVTQVRECAAEILRYAKESAVPVFLIGHITKEGSLAGPKVLEHIVDVVLQFEGDQNHLYRIIRPIKNRFGSTSELGIFEMRQDGLREVANPSELLLSQDYDSLSGVTVASTVEGIRPFLIEVQALVSSAVYGVPQRSATGFDLRRLNMLLAVIEKRAGFKLAAKDVFLNIAGGIKVADPAIDLAVLCAILSSNVDLALDRNVCVAGEVGLSGEVRPVNRIEQRISEAEKLGFSKIIIPKSNLKGLVQKGNIELIPVSRVDQAFKHLFG